MFQNYTISAYYIPVNCKLITESNRLCGAIREY